MINSVAWLFAAMLGVKLDIASKSKHLRECSATLEAVALVYCAFQLSCFVSGDLFKEASEYNLFVSWVDVAMQSLDNVKSLVVSNKQLCTASFLKLSRDLTSTKFSWCLTWSRTVHERGVTSAMTRVLLFAVFSSLPMLQGTLALRK